LKNSQIEQNTNSGKTQIIETTKKEVDLNTFMSLYNTGAFEKIKLEDTVKLKGYQAQTNTGKQLQTNVFGQKIDKVYTVYKTSKPPQVSLLDL